MRMVCSCVPALLERRVSHPNRNRTRAGESISIAERFNAFNRSIDHQSLHLRAFRHQGSGELTARLPWASDRWPGSIMIVVRSFGNCGPELSSHRIVDFSSTLMCSQAALWYGCRS